MLNKKLVAVLFGFACSWCGNAPAEQQLKLIFPRQQSTISVELARTQEERERGLMFRKTLAADRGMLFVYEEPKLLGVWMKNTLIPLDVLFLDSKGLIVSILERLRPCSSDPCPIYTSEGIALFMLEVSAGFVGRQSIKVGDLVTFEMLQN